MRRVFFLFLFLLSTQFFSFGQKGVLYVHEYFPSNVIVYLDSMKLEALDQVYILPPGEYTLKSWAPKFLYTEQKVVITPETVTRVNNIVKYHPDYLTYLRNLHRYNIKEFSKNYSIAVAGSVVFYRLASAKTMNNKIDYYYNNAISSKKKYESATTVNGAKTHKAQFTYNKAMYSKAIARKNTLTALSGVFTGVAAYFVVERMIRGKRRKPVYNEAVMLE